MDITIYLQAILAIVVAVVTTIFIPKLKEYLDTRTTIKQQEFIKGVVKTAVEATEQVFKNQKGVSDAKKQYALNFLSKFNLTVDIDVLSNYIESAVIEMEASLAK